MPVSELRCRAVFRGRAESDPEYVVQGGGVLAFRGAGGLAGFAPALDQLPRDGLGGGAEAERGA
jgi:hypothetical protein